MRSETIYQQQVQVHLEGATVSGALAVPLRRSAVVVPAGGIGSGRLPARIRTALLAVGLATLLIDTFAFATQTRGPS